MMNFTHCIVRGMSCRCFGGLASYKKSRSLGLGLGEVEGQLLKTIRHFSYDELRVATQNFSYRNKIGRGGFGIVYKGTLKNGVQVAVKTLSVESKQGLREFLTEINTISNVKHRYLVALIGCCIEESNRILVYEYMVNNSLDRALFGYVSDRSKLNWEKRSAICLGTARALTFLHEEVAPRIVHRDIKASNILLDKDFQPKIGDFGLAKLFPDDITHISTKIAGTTGYLAPEYALGGPLTLKADVYSFGVVMFELVSGQSSSKANWGGSYKYLLEWAWQLYEEGRLLELVDSEMGDYPEDELFRYMKVAFFCTQATASRRPLMSQVIEMLSSTSRLNEKQLTAPGFLPDSSDTKADANSSQHGNHVFSFGQISFSRASPR